MSPGSSLWFSHKPSRSVSLLVALTLMLVWALFRLVVFSSFLFPLTYVLPLLVCIWTRDRMVLWLMAAVCVGLASVEFLWGPSTGVPTLAAAQAVFAATLANIIIGAGIVHLVVILRNRLESSLSEVTVASEALQAEVTERKHAEEELSRYRDHLEELVAVRTASLEQSRAELRRSEHLASIGTLAGGIAHEINNPVGGIMLAAECALSQDQDHARMSRALAEIIEHAKRTKEIVNDVLLLARQGHSEMKLSDLKVAAKEGVRHTLAYAEQFGCRLELAIKERIPLVMLNQTEMEQAIGNLIRNAIEAGARRVCLSVAGNEEAVLLEVEDDGDGIPEDQLGKVFDPFYSTRRTCGGTGLGLSIVHSVIRNHGGSIRVDSTPGQGTRFTVRLPMLESRHRWE